MAARNGRDGGLTLRHIESYNLVSATGSTLAAAARLGMSQSSVSRMLAQLEAYLGIRLFERDKNRLVPTREGLHLGPRIRAIADQLEAVRHSAAELRTGNSQDVLLQIALPVSLTQTMAPRLIRSFLERHDQIRIEVEVAGYVAIERMVAEGRVEIGFSRRPLRTAGLAVLAELEAGSVCVVPRGHPLAERSVLSPRELRGVPLILLGRERAMRAEIETAFYRMGVTASPRVEAHTVGLACALAAEGLGVAIVNRLMASEYAGLPIALIRFDPDLANRFCVIAAEKRPMSAMARQMAGFMSDFLRDRAAVADAEAAGSGALQP